MTFPVIAQVEQKVIIEHFTNTRCGICASRNPAFYQTLAYYPQALHIAYHPSSPYSSCAFNMHNSSENDQRTYFYNIYGGTPRAVIQGEVVAPGNPLITADKIDLEASGNVNLDTIKGISQTGVDYVSIGALTHSVKALDYSLLVV